MAFMLLFLWQYICIAVEFEGSCMCEKDFSKGFFFFPEKFLWLPKGIRSYFPLIVVLESIPQLGISVPVLKVLKERDIKKNNFGSTKWHWSAISAMKEQKEMGYSLELLAVVMPAC